LAAIWGVHPLLTESVTNIVGRADLLAALGVLAGLLCHMKRAASAGRGGAWLAALAAAQTVAIFSKESGVVLPGLMLLYDLIWADRSNWRRRTAGYAAVAAPLALFFFVRAGLGMHMQIDPAENPLVAAGFWAARLTALKVVGKYLALLLWPVRLSADYSYNAVPVYSWGLWDWGDIQLVIGLAALTGAVLLAAGLARRGWGMARLALFFLLFFLVAFSPVSNLVILIGSIMAERFLYLPSVGFVGCVVAMMWLLRERWPALRPLRATAGWAVVGLVCAALGVRTYARNLDWQDSLRLWTSTVTASPDSARAHYNLAKELERDPGRLTDAIAEYREAVRIDPGRADAHDNLGNALSAMPGGLAEAIVEYRAALRTDPGQAVIHNDLANALARTPEHLPDAIDEYRAALGIDPRNAEVHYNLANALAAIPARLPEAIAEYRAALEIQPDHADAHNNLGYALSGMPGRMSEAVGEYRTALRIQPDLVAAHNNLANVLSGIPGKLPEAIAEYQAAIRIQPDNAEAHYNLGNALAVTPGRMAEALREFQAAVRSAPQFVEAHISLGKALALTPGRRLEAIAEYETAFRLRPDPNILQVLDKLRAGPQ
jgi:tetratricopeptide (TPR) repeat protein